MDENQNPMPEEETTVEGATLEAAAEDVTEEETPAGE